MAKFASSEVEEEETEAVEVGEAEEALAEEVKKEEEKEAVVRPWRKRRSRGSRAVSGVGKKDFMEFARKYYPALVKDFETGRIPFDELKAKIERDVGLVWVDLKE